MIVNTTLSHLPELAARFPHVSIVGVGNEGASIVSHIFGDGASGAQCVAVSTDENELEGIYSHEKVLISPRVGSDIAEECARLLTPLLTGADVVFLVAKLSASGTIGMAPIIGEVARQAGAVVIGVAITPPSFDGESRLAASHELTKMREHAHTLTVVDTNRLMRSVPYLSNPFGDCSDRVVIEMVSGLTETLTCPSIVNIDMAAFRELMTHGGIAHLGIAHSASALRAEEATIGALRHTLLYDNIARARGALINIRGDSSLTIEEAERAAELVQERTEWNTPIVMGARVDESLCDGLEVSILMTGGAYPYIPGGYRRLPLAMYEMEPDGEEEGPISIDLDLDQLEEP